MVFKQLLKGIRMAIENHWGSFGSMFPHKRAKFGLKNRILDTRFYVITMDPVTRPVLAGFGRLTDVFGLRPDLLPDAPHTRMT